MNRYTTTITIDTCDVKGIYILVLDKTTITHSHSTHTEPTVYTVYTTSPTGIDKRVLLQTHDVGHATTMYMDTIERCTSIANTIDKWFIENRPKVDKGMSSLFDRIINSNNKSRDTYGTRMED